MVTRRSLILLLAIALLGCRPASPTPTAAPVIQETPLLETVPTKPANPDQSNQPGVTVEQIKNAAYQLGVVNVPRTVQLVNGTYQEGAAGGADFVDVHLTDFIALGDIDGDGINEAAALFAENYGGSGVFVFLAIYSLQNQQAAFRTSVFVEDRPQIEDVAIEHGEVRLDVTVHGLDEQGNAEPMCCPTLKTKRHYRLINDQLDLSDYATFTPDGKPRTIMIQSPVNGAEVLSSVQIKGSVAIAPFENTLTYSIKDGAGVELSRGAVTVTTTDPGAHATFDAVIPLGKILSSTVIVIEIQDISAADGSLLAMDSVELVVK